MTDGWVDGRKGGWTREPKGSDRTHTQWTGLIEVTAAITHSHTLQASILTDQTGVLMVTSTAQGHSRAWQTGHTHQTVTCNNSRQVVKRRINKLMLSYMGWPHEASLLRPSRWPAQVKLALCQGYNIHPPHLTPTSRQTDMQLMHSMVKNVKTGPMGSVQNTYMTDKYVYSSMVKSVKTGQVGGM